MTGIDYILDVHRREREFHEAISTLVGLVLFLLGWLVYSLIA